MDINNLTKQHGKSVAFVFKKRGVNAAVTPNNVMLQTILHGESFITDVEKQIEADLLGMESFEGPFFPGIRAALDFVKNNPKQAQTNADAYNKTKTLETVTVNAKKKSKTFGDGLRSVLGTVAGLFGTYQGAKNTATPTYAASNVQTDVEVKQKKKFDYILIGSIVLIVVLAIVLITKKK